MPGETEPALHESALKRPREGSEGDEERIREAVEDPDPPEDVKVGALEAAEVLMLGQKKIKNSCSHSGRYDICELFSPPRVVAEAASMGFRGGWSLGLNRIDPVTNRKWDLSQESEQGKV